MSEKLVKPAGAPWLPALYEKHNVMALKALRAGTAIDGQQREALDYIIQVLAGTYDLSYRPTSDRDTAFAEGRRFVGLQIVKLLNMPAGLLDAADANQKAKNVGRKR